MACSIVAFFLVFTQKPAPAKKTKTRCDKKPQATKANENQENLRPAELKWYVHASLFIFDKAKALILIQVFLSCRLRRRIGKRRIWDALMHPPDARPQTPAKDSVLCTPVCYSHCAAAFSYSCSELSECWRAFSNRRHSSSARNCASRAC